MSNPLSKKRRQAFTAQAGRCCYCGFLMWLEDPVEFARAVGLPATAVHVLQCTVEHLQARQEGGTHRAVNIAAACWACNKRRHARGTPAMDPERYRGYVQRRIAKRRWHPQQLFRRELMNGLSVGAAAPRGVTGRYAEQVLEGTSSRVSNRRPRRPARMAHRNHPSG